MAEAEAAGGLSGAAEAGEALEGTRKHAGEELRRMGVCGGTGVRAGTGVRGGTGATPGRGRSRARAGEEVADE